MLGTADIRLNELENNIKRFTSDYEAMMITLQSLKKRIDNISSSNDSINMRLDNLENLVEKHM